MFSSKKPSFKQLVICSSNQSVTTLVDLVNMYQILGQALKPSYHSVLETNSFSQKLTMQPRHQYQPPASRTYYLLKTSSTNLFAKEPVQKNISHPYELVKSLSLLDAILFLYIQKRQSLFIETSFITTS